MQLHSSSASGASAAMSPDWLQAGSSPVAAEILSLQRELARTLDKLHGRVATEQLRYYRPSAPQLEFHAAGSRFRERLLMASNQSGKTFCGSREVAYHLTGEYPDWWEGVRFDHPVVIYAGSETAELTRNGVQRLLVGPPAEEDQWGTGAIPRRCLVDWARASGSVADALDYVVVKHVSGGNSRCYFKNYAQGRKKWQADTIHVAWFDEEPPEAIYTEGITRTNIHMGPVLVTFTPLLGLSRVVMRFINPEPGDMSGARHRCHTNMTLDNCGLYTPEQIEQIVASYPEHEREARTRGIPVLGSGLVWPFHVEDYAVDPFDVPDTWPAIGGMDFGWDHPFAATLLRHDRQTDTLYVTREFRVRLKAPADHCAVLRQWDRPGFARIPWAWPHDGKRKDKDPGGLEYAKLYQGHGLDMLPEHATFEGEGGYGLEAGVMDIHDRMAAGRWKVFRNCPQWIEEQRMYHRKDGVIVPLKDDLLSAGRQALMMRRHARLLRRAGGQARFYNQ